MSSARKRTKVSNRHYKRSPLRRLWGSPRTWWPYERVKALWVGNPSLCLQPDVAGETAVYRVSTFE